MINKIPGFLDPRKDRGRAVALVAVILLVGLGSFGLGRLSASSPSHGGGLIVQEAEAVASVSGALEGGVVASKSGTKYYFPWCGSAQNISDSNKIWFQTTKEARDAGYEPASNCKGLK